MRYALIVAGGSGTRLWPLSRQDRPKQLIPFVDGRSLLEIANERLDGLIPRDQRYVCAAEAHRELIQRALGHHEDWWFIGEPEGRDTLAAIGLGTAVIARDDPEAVIGVFTADHLIEPPQEFRAIVEQGYRFAEEEKETLVTFGVRPTHPATGYGYLQLGKRAGLESDDRHLQTVGARFVEQFREKPDAETAKQYVDAGPDRYLWNSGMFVWGAQTLLHCIGRYEPDVYEGLKQIAEKWPDPDRRQQALETTYPELRKTSIDYAVMERAAADPDEHVVAIPMPVHWMDVGSWNAYERTQPRDEQGNRCGAERALLRDTRHTLVVSTDPQHLIATVGCEDLVIVHTADATLVCPKERAAQVKQLYDEAAESFQNPPL
jgi:mannose-1-phosphate guanylyltransferase